MKVVFLGTGSSVPSPDRTLSSVALCHNSEIILFDCGEGTQLQIQRAGLHPSKISTIFISHLHGDHFFGLPGFLTSQQMQGRTAPLRIFGPKGLQQFIGCIRQLTNFVPDFVAEIIEAKVNDENCWDMKQGRVVAHWLDHGLPTLGFRYEENPKRGKFNAELAERLGVPDGPVRKMLLDGHSIVLEDGTNVSPDQVLGPVRPGKVVVYCVDTKPCKACLCLAEDADLLIHDGTFDTTEPVRASQTGHSTVTQAAEMASRARSKKLAITHISARYGTDDIDDLLSHAQTVFKNTIIATDLQVLEV